MNADFCPDTLYYGDCLEVMRQWSADVVDLVVMDPPFKSNQDYNVLFGKGEPGEQTAQVRAFNDTWSWDDAAQDRTERIIRGSEGHDARKPVEHLLGLLGECGMMAYLTYMADRFARIRIVLRPDGSMYVHCDDTAVCYLRLLLCGMRGWKGMFRNMLTWERHKGRSDAQGYARVADHILFFAPKDKVWHTQYLPHRPEYLKQTYRHIDERGRYSSRDLTAPGHGNVTAPSAKPWRGIDPAAHGRHWTTPTKGSMNDLILECGLVPEWPMEGSSVHERLDALDKAGLIHWPKKAGGMPRLRMYEDASPGRAMSSIITHINALQAGNSMGYDTEKPVALPELFILSSSNPGDVVLDPFGGCGSATEAAFKARRSFVAIDLMPFALELTNRRLPKDRKARIVGIPEDVESAKRMHEENPFHFETWMVTRMGNGFLPNDKQRGDGGVDGRATLLGNDTQGRRKVVVQVKGEYRANDMNAFLHVIEKEKAALGVFVTVYKAGKAARNKARGLPPVKIGADEYPRCLLWSAEEMFARLTSPWPTMVGVDGQGPAQQGALSL